MAGSPRKTPAGWSAIARLPVPALITSDAWQKGGATIAFANEAFCALTGYQPAELAGRNTRLLHGPRTDVGLLRRDAAAGRSGAEHGEAWLHRKDGTAFYAEWRGRALAASRPALVIVYQDQSERWAQREALIEGQRLGLAGLLASGVAHDFHNLLSIINGYCEILAKKVSGQPAARAELEEIHRAGLKAAAIARQILQFSRRRETNVAVVNFNPLIREMAELIRRLCGDAISVELRLASDLGNTRIDAVRFQQVLLNLCFNARDAMADGGRLKLRTFNQGAPGGGSGAEVGLEVTDTGHGIDEALRARIFEPLFTTKPDGTGLGLPLVRGLVEEAGGRLELRSVAGRGTTFAIFLPETAEAVDVASETAGALPQAKGSEVVLLIERDDALRRMIGGILTADGYQVTEAGTAKQALAAGPPPPHLVIADVPTAGGRAALLRALARPQAPLLLSTAARLERPRGRGRIAHLPKPFALSTLLAKVRAMLDGP